MWFVTSTHSRVLRRTCSKYPLCQMDPLTANPDSRARLLTAALNERMIVGMEFGEDLPNNSVAPVDLSWRFASGNFEWIVKTP